MVHPCLPENLKHRNLPPARPLNPRFLTSTNFVTNDLNFSSDRKIFDYDNLLINVMSETKKTAEPCVMVIFGATGDLTKRKLFPALYNLAKEEFLPENFAIVGVGRQEMTSDDFRKCRRQFQGIRTACRRQKTAQMVRGTSLLHGRRF